MKHNKKRNTAFIYEILVREITQAIIDKSADRKAKIISLVKEHFEGATTLGEELALYHTLLETKNIDKSVANRMVTEVKKAYESLDKEAIFEAQSKLIAAINRELGQEVWKTFVPNFKSLASINAIFNDKAPLKKRVLFEQSIVDRMSEAETLSEEQTMKPLDNLTYKSFIKKFNEKYDPLLTEQKDLLNQFIASFADDGLTLKIYLNEELTRLKGAINEAIEDDTVIGQKAHAVMEYLEEFRKREFTPDDLKKILTTQELVRELRADD